MRKVEDLEQMIHHAAEVRISRGTGHRNAWITAWPTRKIIYLHPNWLNEDEASDQAVRDCLFHELGHRKDWAFTSVTLLILFGFILTGIAVGLNIASPMLKGILTVQKDWVLYGFLVMFAGNYLRGFLFYGIFERRADAYAKRLTAEDLVPSV